MKMNDMRLENVGSLITIEENSQCLGYLMDFKDQGVFDAEYGRVSVSPADAETHNQLLDEALLKGLDESCKVGQAGTFYFVEDRIQTFLGTLVTDRISTNGRSVTFYRNGKTYRGRSSPDHDMLNFRRVA